MFILQNIFKRRPLHHRGDHARRLPLLVLLIGIAALTVLAILFVDRGPLERGLIGDELGYWQAAVGAGSNPDVTGRGFGG